jgi:thymidine kinase
MGPARRGGKMTSGKATDEFEDASLAVLARARYLGIVPARDTKASEQLVAGRSGNGALLHKFATSDLTDGSVFTYANLDNACYDYAWKDP